MKIVKLAALGVIAVFGAAAVVAVFLIVSANKVKKDVEALKGWKSEGRALEKIKKDSKNIGPIKNVLVHEGKAVPHLVKAVRSWTPEEAVAAMIALGLLQAAEGIAPLVEILKKDEGEGGKAAAAALSRFKGKAAEPLKQVAQGIGDLPPAVRLHVYQAMAWTYEEALLGTVSAGLKDPAPEVALAVGGLLSARKAELLVAPLLEALGSDSPELAKAAVQGLVSNKESFKVDALDGALKSPKAHVAAGALGVLGKMDRIFAAKKATPLVEDPREEVAVAAAEALLEMGEKVPPAKIVAHLESKNAEIAERTAKVLQAARAVDLKDRYVALLAHENPHTRKAAADLLRLCAKADPGNLLAEPAIPALMELLKEPDLAPSAAHTLRVLTRNETSGDNFVEWDRWWTRYKEVQSRINEAEGNYVKVKAWEESGEVRQKVQEAIALLERALELYEEIPEKGLDSRTFDNECTRIGVLLRQVRTHLAGEEGD